MQILTASVELRFPTCFCLINIRLYSIGHLSLFVQRGEHSYCSDRLLVKVYAKQQQQQKKRQYDYRNDARHFSKLMDLYEARRSELHREAAYV